jgi:hypothetical protein
MCPRYAEMYRIVEHDISPEFDVKLVMSRPMQFIELCTLLDVSLIVLNEELPPNSAWPFQLLAVLDISIGIEVELFADDNVVFVSALRASVANRFKVEP